MVEGESEFRETDVVKERKDVPFGEVAGLDLLDASGTGGIVSMSKKGRYDLTY